MPILGIETSCDETSAAVYGTQGGVLSNSVFSQIPLHRTYGGVVPEIASRSHIEKIGPIVAYALKSAGVRLGEIEHIGVTSHPGLPGSLAVGVAFAKALAYGVGKPVIGISHLEGHIFSSFLEHSPPFPHLCVVVSGGHTSLYLVEDFGKFTEIGRTLDDAAGEAFDKVAGLMGLGYPGGPIIEKLASKVNFKDFMHYPRGTKGRLDFSFSGLKTAVLYDLVRRGAYNLSTKKFLEEDNEQLKQQVASSLLCCVADVLNEKIETAFASGVRFKAVTLTGGVACNRYIRMRMQEKCKQLEVDFVVPSSHFCTDNAAMIAFVASKKKLVHGPNFVSNLDLY